MLAKFLTIDVGYILETSLKAKLQDMTPLKVTPFNALAMRRVNSSLSLGGGLKKALFSYLFWLPLW